MKLGQNNKYDIKETCKFDFREVFWRFFYLLDNKQVEEAAKRVEKEKELAKVSIRKEDVDLIADEMEISKSKAERTLREHVGNVVEALIVLTNWIEWIKIDDCIEKCILEKLFLKFWTTWWCISNTELRSPNLKLNVNTIVPLV